MVQRRHLKYAFLAQLIRPNLKNHRERLKDKYSTNKGQQQLLLNDDRNCPDRSSQGQRSYVTHKDFSRMRVVPEEANAGSDHCSTKDGQLADLWHALQFEVAGKDRVPANIS